MAIRPHDKWTAMWVAYEAMNLPPAVEKNVKRGLTRLTFNVCECVKNG